MWDRTTFKPSSPDLELIEPSQLDPRSDEEIAAFIQSNRPVTSPKNVWSFWDKGWNAMERWKKRCVISWVRRLDASWHVRVLDLVPGSPHHISRFGIDHLLPDALSENRMTGRHAPQHAADMIRLPLIYVHGGVWLDVATYLFRDLDDICWDAISDPHNPHRICGIQVIRERRNGKSPLLMNNFIASLPRDPFLLNWQKIFLSVWEGRVDSVNISDHPLIAAFRVLPPPRLNGTTTETFSNNDMSDYIAHMICWDRLVSTRDSSTGFDGKEYWKRHFRLIPFSEIMPQHFLSDPNAFTESESLRLLGLSRSEPISRTDRDQLDAERLVEGILAHASFRKMISGLWRDRRKTIAGTWDARDKEDPDIKPGTWVEYLRWGSIFLKQKRQLSTMEAEVALTAGGAKRCTYEVGLLEPIVPGQTPQVTKEML